MEWTEEDQVDENSESENEATAESDSNSSNDNDDDNDDVEGDGDGKQTHNERDSIRSELKSMSFAELLALKEKLGSKVYNEAIFGNESSAIKQRKKNPKRSNEFKRENKNRPREISAKKQVPLLSSVKKSSANSTGPRDPRFDSKCGDFDRDKFKEDYSFVNEIREKEISELKSKLKHLKGAEATEEKQKVKTVLQRMQNQNLEEKKLTERKQAMANERAINKNAIKSERKPFFVPKREQKAKDLVKQFEELKNSGKLNKHLEKRRKKNLSRDRKKYQFD